MVQPTFVYESCSPIQIGFKRIRVQNNSFIKVLNCLVNLPPAVKKTSPIIIGDRDFFGFVFNNVGPQGEGVFPYRYLSAREVRGRLLSGGRPAQELYLRG